MKTIEIKNTLKEIAKNYASGDARTASTYLFKLSHDCGKSVFELADFAEKKISKKCARNVMRAYLFRKHDKDVLLSRCESATTTVADIIHLVRTSLAEFKTSPSNYSKVAILGNTGVYLASPVYRHEDYNKVRIADIAELPARVVDIIARY